MQKNSPPVHEPQSAFSLFPTNFELTVADSPGMSSAPGSPDSSRTHSLAARLFPLVESYATAESESEFELELGRTIASETAAVVVAIIRPDAAEPIAILHSSGAVPANLDAWMLRCAVHSLASGQTVRDEARLKDGSVALWLSPVHGRDEVVAALVSGPASQSVPIELCAAMITHRDATLKSLRYEETIHQLAALTDLISRVESSQGRDEAVNGIARHLQDYLDASRVFVALAKHDKLRIVAASHRDSVDETSEESRLALSLLREAVCRGEVSAWPPQPSGGTEDRHALLCHGQYAESQKLKSVTGVPIADHGGTLRGAVLVAHEEEAPQRCLPFLRAAARPLANSLMLFERANQNRLQRWFWSLFSTARRQRTRFALCIAGMIAASMLVPVPYRVKARCKLEPTNKRFLAAPFDGQLLKCLVQPGDVVTEGQLLAYLDGQETEWELASVHAELERAVKERVGHVALHESGKARLARHQIEYLQSREQLLADRIEQLEVRSPVEGIVVSGDLTKSEGVPLRKGQSLFEIAPLDSMIAELEVPEDDVRFIAANCPVRIRFDAFPYSPRSTEVQKVRPRSEVRKDENVFVAEADIPNSAGELRPGMEGTARLLTESRPLGWVLLHKPVGALVSWLGI